MLGCLTIVFYSFTVFSGDIKKKKKKKALKMTKFSELFYLFFFRPHDPKSEKKFP